MAETKASSSEDKETVEESQVDESESFEEKDIHFIRLIKIVMSEGKRGLHAIFCWGCPKKQSDNQTMMEYLGSKMSSRDIKKFFDRTMRAVMEKDKSGSNFDVTLLYACIQHTCLHLAEHGSPVWSTKADDNLEYVLTALKNIRSDIVHFPIEHWVEDVAKEKMEDFEGLLLKAVKLAGVLYGKDDEAKNVIDVIKKKISSIKNSTLRFKDKEEYMKKFEELKEYHIKVLEGCTEELKERYKVLSHVDPASFLTGREELQVETVFTKLDLIRDQQQPEHVHTEDVSYENLVEILNSDSKVSMLSLVGLAGMGKTTIMKLLLSEWANASKKKPTVKGLEQYKVVLYHECKNNIISTFLDLLLVHFPTSSYQLTDSDLERSVLEVQCLLLIDGFDELNVASKRLLEEIMTTKLCRAGKMKILVTTRATKLPELPKLSNKQPFHHVNIAGIPYERMFEFVSRLHEQMVAQGHSTQNTQDLVSYMKRTHAHLKSHYRLPLNLTLLTYLWATHSEDMNDITTSTGLYVTLHELIKQRLVDRLYTQDRNAKPRAVRESVGEAVQTSNQCTPVKISKKCKKGQKNQPKQTNSEVQKQPSLNTVSTSTQTTPDDVLPVTEKILTPQNLQDLCSQFAVVLYEVCLTEISQRSVLLSDSSTKKLHDKCRELGLPVDDMFAAFLACEPKWTPLGYKYQLAAPHKSMLEFYAANHIYNCLFQQDQGQNEGDFVEELRNLCKKYNRTEKEVKQYLHIAQNHKRQTPRVTLPSFMKTVVRCNAHTFYDYQNVLLHLGGLMAHHRPEALQDHGEDLVNLLRQARLDKKQWLNLVTETNCNDTITEHVAKNIETKLDVCDDQVRAALAIFKHLERRVPVQVRLDCDVRHLTHLHPMLTTLATRDCMVELHLKHQWRDNDCGASDNTLGLLLGGSCTLTAFTGYLHDLQLLPDTITRLRWAIFDDAQAEMFVDKLPDLELEYIGVHIAAGVNPRLLKPLPQVKPRLKECGSLWLSGVTNKNMEWAVQVITALLPPEGQYNCLFLPGSQLTTGRVRELVDALGEGRVRVQQKGSLKLCSPTITREEVIALRPVVKQAIGCGFYCLGESEWP